MSFIRKNVLIGPNVRVADQHEYDTSISRGTRPSPLDGRPTISTGTPSLDQYLAGHAGFPLGTSILLAESGTTDFSGVLLKYYTAEGLVQGHHVHVIGLDESWQAELPGLSQDANINDPSQEQAFAEKMRIAWRYQGLTSGDKVIGGTQGATSPGKPHFCHRFDLSRTLEPRTIRGQLHSIPLDSPSRSSRPAKSTQAALQDVITTLASSIKASGGGSLHRVIIPDLLSPTLHPQLYCEPLEALRFLHNLRAVLRKHTGQSSAMLSLSTLLYPRATGFIRWIEILCDGVLEVIPAQPPVHLQPHREKTDVSAQGIIRVHKLPIHNERGGGIDGGASRENLSFRLSPLSGLTIKPFSLPPVNNTEVIIGERADKSIVF
ncbi:hypothetical protein ACRALDRAFT_1059142 [Sodiomyces alcalophilus JCM 7366]|uniref:uncharacterized protein n=1 Tax=Sodiomyces alcalophilus JCM 7366 TaxID=591952 RepID=UPI0039B5ABCC